MAWWMAVPAALQTTGAIVGAIGQRRQADLVRRFGAEQARRMRFEHDRTIGEAAARGAASGVEFESESLQKYLADMTQEFRIEEDWVRKAAEAEAKAMRTASTFSMFSGIGSSLLSYGQMTNWGIK